MTSNLKSNLLIVTAIALGTGPVWAAEKSKEREKDDEKEETSAPPASQPAKPVLPKCPVMGGPIDINVSVPSADGPVYFCCKSCIKDYKANPKKFADKVAEQRKALAKLPRVQVACPVTGRPVDKNKRFFVEQDGQKIYFCSPNCPKRYSQLSSQDPKKYKTRLDAGYTYQTKCPIDGEPIDPAVFVADLPDRMRVWFCSPDCADRFHRDAAKYAKKLEEQGVHLDLKKMGLARPGAAKEKDGRSKKPGDTSSPKSGGREGAERERHEHEMRMTEEE